MLATLGGLAVGALALALLGHLSDQRERRNIASKLFASHAALSKGALVNATRRNHNRDKDMRSPIGDKKASFSTPSSPTMNSNLTRPADKSRINLNANPTRLLEDSLPQVLQVRKSLLNRVVREMAQHHRWLAVMTRYSETFPRSLRVLSLATNIIVMLFMQALVYALSNPDDGTCGNLTSQAACLRPRADFSGGGVSKCSWKPQGGQDKGGCSFAEPANAVTVVLFVAMFSAVVSAPIAVCLHKIIQITLAAPVALDLTQASSLTSSPVTSPAVSRKPKRTTLLQSMFAGGTGTTVQDKDEKEQEERQARDQLVSLSQALQKHRTTLPTKYREEFDGTHYIQ